MTRRERERERERERGHSYRLNKTIDMKDEPRTDNKELQFLQVITQHHHCGAFLLLCHLPFLASVLAFRPPGLGSYLMRATASYSNEGLVAAAIEPYAADCYRVSAVGL